jgi:hypothetical protein
MSKASVASPSRRSIPQKPSTLTKPAEKVASVLADIGLRLEGVLDGLRLNAIQPSRPGGLLRVLGDELAAQVERLNTMSKAGVTPKSHVLPDGLAELLHHVEDRCNRAVAVINVAARALEDNEFRIDADEDMARALGASLERIAEDLTSVSDRAAKAAMAGTCVVKKDTPVRSRTV